MGAKPGQGAKEGETNRRKRNVQFTLEQAAKSQRGEWRYSSALSVTSMLDAVRGQRHASAALPLGKRPGTHCIGGWVGLRAGMDGCGKSRPHRDSIPGSSSP
jgi:hypothetical protein